MRQIIKTSIFVVTVISILTFAWTRALATEAIEQINNNETLEQNEQIATIIANISKDDNVPEINTNGLYELDFHAYDFKRNLIHEPYAENFISTTEPIEHTINGNVGYDVLTYITDVNDDYADSISTSTYDDVKNIALISEGYGPYGVFLKPIEPPIEGSIPINNRADLEAINNNLNGNYHLTTDIDLSGIEWIPIGDGQTDEYYSFTGIFDGQGHMIFHMRIQNNEYVYNGLFGHISNGAKILNLRIDDYLIRNESYIWRMYSGGICGFAQDSFIYNCFNAGDIKPSSKKSNSYSGGICGYSKNTDISFCHNYGNISASSTYYQSFAGGICGQFSGTIASCYNTGNISSSSIIDNDENLFGIASAYAGGICGSINSSECIANCFNTGDITATVASPNNLSVSYVGGLFGSCESSKFIYNCYSTGNISSSTTAYDRLNSYIGGICGRSASPIYNCYSAVDISFSVESLTSYENEYFGGICGSGAISDMGNCYWSIDKSQISNGIPITDKLGVGGNTLDNKTTPLTNEQMKQAVSYNGFDFASVWAIQDDINNGYPYFQSLSATPVIPAIYTISFNSNGGTVPIDSLITGLDGKLAVLPEPTRSANYKFDGWYTELFGGTLVTLDFIYNETVTVYAHWLYIGSIALPPPTTGVPAAAVGAWDLPIGEVGKPYNAQALIFDDQGYIHTLTVIKGKLPRGLILDYDGTIKGVPTGSGFITETGYNFDIMVSWEDIEKTQTIQNLYFVIGFPYKATTPFISAMTASFRTDITIPANSGDVVYKFIAPTTYITILDAFPQMYHIDGSPSTPPNRMYSPPMPDGTRGHSYQTWRTTVGETYYLVFSDDPNEIITQLLPYTPNVINNLLNFKQRTLVKTSESIMKSFPNESNIKWDIWTLTYEYLYDSDVVFGFIFGHGAQILVADYKAYFDESVFITSWGREALDYFSYNDVPDEIKKKITIEEDKQLSYMGLYIALPYNQPHLNGTIVQKQNIYVPVDSKLYIDDEDILHGISVYSIIVSSGTGGNASGSGKYDAGANVTLTAAPNYNYIFDGWYENNVKITSAGMTYIFTATADRSLQARFTNISDSGFIPSPGSSHNQPTISVADALQPLSGDLAKPINENDAIIKKDRIIPRTTAGKTKRSLVWSNPFSDVSDTDWFFNAIRFVTEHGLMNGTGLNVFSPDAYMSRAMLVTVLYRLEGEPVMNGNCLSYTDVDSGQWYSNAIAWACEKGIAGGYGDGNFGLNDPVTREQTVALFYRYAKYKNIDITEFVDLTKYADFEDISDWAMDSMKWAVAVEIIKGRTEATIVPQGTSTRAEVATVLKRFIENLTISGTQLGSAW